MLPQYEYLATGRDISLFKQDVEKNKNLLYSAFTKSRIAIIGAAGSIGYSIVKNPTRQPRWKSHHLYNGGQSRCYIGTYF